MECNKDEALRAKEIAERKFTERNYAGAKKFALKAQNLYPGLEGIPQMLMTLDVYISAENKINGEVDWYGILSVNPLADDDTIRKQYRKLALTLHPDKNKSLGAEGAFKLVSEAWTLLSDKSKRLAYNQLRNVKGFQQKFPTQTGGTSAPPSANGFQNFTSTVTSNASTQRSNSRTNSSPLPKKADTFWTVCNKCKTHYEYLRIYLNHTLLCPNCHEAFVALEKAPPPNVFKSSNWSRQQHQSSRHHSGSNNPYNSGRNFVGAQNSEPGVSSRQNSFNNTNFQWGAFSRTAGSGSTVASASAAAQAANVVQQASEKVKREREDGQSLAEWERNRLSRGMGNPSFKDKSLKKRKLDDNNLNSYGGFMANNMTIGNGRAGVQGVSEIRKGNAEIDKIFGCSGTYIKPNATRELSYIEIRNMLIEKARTDIQKMLEVWRSRTELDTKRRESVKEKSKVNKKQSMVNGDTRTQRYGRKKSVAGASSGDTEKGATAPMSINVPDPDFHNFDVDRTESSFGEDQVWAAYDDDDGMPRFYARIHKVISLRPFKMRISWLNSRTNSELGPIDWIGSGFTKTCGEFRTGRHEMSRTLNSFSHKVSWTKGTRGVVQIYPKKGEVWAIYKNWSPEWNEHTSEEVRHKYEMVEVLDDFSEEEGVSVALLIKVAGFKTVFEKNMDSQKVRRIPKEEMFQFSHQVPNCLLTGQEAHNAPKGCHELDPAATPLELLQVITEAHEAPAVENGIKEDEKVLKGVQKGEVNEASEAVSKTKEAEVTLNSEHIKDDRECCITR
ncbi:hypothetical protein FEM48_Zijuj03G0170800 [Ziziphus jujuba var. spinosa]|uniref:J domain-containing protein n=1 Tax=Ziziphus jujuba var. spinosa TaxID=714518 RepID=A0A978VRJ7_ZIZJJ|nr:hypothetical protein FEM48_Zijuj03G0170800 [Ziziphus jujuba var. spinosa]